MKKIFFVLFFVCIFINIKFNSACGYTLNDNKDIINLFNQNEELVQVFNYNNKNLCISNDNIHLMAQVVYAESRAEPFNGKVAVASVILNRVTDPEFPKTIEGVIKQKYAFSCVVNGEIHVTPDTDCFNAVKEALNGADPSKKAIYFYNPTITTCSWMKSVKKDNVKKIGNHVFFHID